MNTLISQIRALGYIPRGEDALSQRLRYAKRKRYFSESQLAELTELAAYDVAKFPGSRSNESVLRAARSVAVEGKLAQRSERMNTLMAQIRALGHLPRKNPGLGDEYALACRIHTAKGRGLLSASQLAELSQMLRINPRDASQLAAGRMVTLMAEIRSLGHIPRRNRAEDALRQRLNAAKRKKLLSESQLAEVAELARSSDEPLRKRLRVLDV